MSTIHDPDRTTNRRVEVTHANVENLIRGAKRLTPVTIASWDPALVGELANPGAKHGQ